MCLLCVEFEKGKMTTQEVLNNIGEMIDGKSEEEQKHLFELADRAMNKETPFKEWDEDSEMGFLDELDLAFMPDED